VIASLLLAQLVASPSPSTLPSPVPVATAIPVRDYGFIAVPKTWQLHRIESNLSFRRLGDWTHGGSAGEEVTVDMMPSYGLSLHDFVRYYGRGFSRGSGFSLLSSGAQPLCDGVAGWTQSYNDAGGGGLTIVYGVTVARAYVAAYSYPGYPGASPEGRASIATLCPPRDPAGRVASPPMDAPANWAAQDVGYLEPPQRGYASWLLFPKANSIPTQVIWVMELPMQQHRGLSYGVTYYLSKMLADPTVLRRAPLSLCGGTLDGVSIEVHGLRDKRPVDVAGAVTVKDGKGYFALYSRPANQSDDADAIHAIRSLCPR
jgi:hypothetical protein